MWILSFDLYHWFKLILRLSHCWNCNCFPFIVLGLLLKIRFINSTSIGVFNVGSQLNWFHVLYNSLTLVFIIFGDDLMYIYVILLLIHWFCFILMIFHVISYQFVCCYFLQLFIIILPFKSVFVCLESKNDYSWFLISARSEFRSHVKSHDTNRCTTCPWCTANVITTRACSFQKLIVTL